MPGRLYSFCLFPSHRPLLYQSSTLSLIQPWRPQRRRKRESALWRVELEILPMPLPCFLLRLAPRVAAARLIGLLSERRTRTSCGTSSKLDAGSRRRKLQEAA